MKKIRFILVFLTVSSGILVTVNCGLFSSTIKQIRQEAERHRLYQASEQAQRLMQEGVKAFDEKNFGLAVEKFEQGFKTAPANPGSAPVFLNNKSQALISRGVETYNKNLTLDRETRNAARESIKKDFEEAIASAEKALQILKTATSGFEGWQKFLSLHNLSSLTNRKEAYRLISLTGADQTKGKEALNAFREYLAAETDSFKKDKAQLDLAVTLQQSKEPELAIAEFRRILEKDPNNPDALAGVGLNLVNIGYLNSDTDQLKEAEKYLRHYVGTAPADHKFKAEAEQIIESLKETEAPNKAPGKSFPSRGKTNGYTVSEAKIADPNSPTSNKTSEK